MADMNGARLMVWAGSSGFSTLHVENDRCAADVSTTGDCREAQCVFSGYVMKKADPE